MKKYLGSKMTAFAAIVSPLFLFCPLLFGVFALCAEISGATVFLASGSIACTILWGLYINSISYQLYSWGTFTNDSIQMTTGLTKKNTLLYEQCKGCGIGFYIHGILNSSIGTKIWYIYFSYDMFDENYRSKINLWKSSPTQIKVQFNKKLYEYLLTVLPKKQSQMLFLDYKKYFGQHGGIAQ